jgi:hypothetical protein
MKRALLVAAWLVGFPLGVAVFGTAIGLLGGPVVVLAALAAGGYASAARSRRKTKAAK